MARMANDQINAADDVAGLVETKATKKTAYLKAPKMATVDTMTAEASNPKKS